MKHSIEHVTTCVEELEDEADCNAVDQVREEVDGLESAAAADLERQHAGQGQGQANLDQRAGHVVKAQLQGGERVGTGEDINVVLEADEFTRADVLHLVERVADHGSERPIREDYEQCDRNCAEGDDNTGLAPISGLLIEWDLDLLGRFHCCCSHDIPLR